MLRSVILTHRMKHIDEPAFRDRRSGVLHAPRNDANIAWLHNLLLTPDLKLEGSHHDMGDLLMWMGMEWKGGPLIHIPVGYCHVLGVNEPNVVAGNDLFLRKVLEMNECHTGRKREGVFMHSVILSFSRGAGEIAENIDFNGMLPPPPPLLRERKTVYYFRLWRRNAQITKTTAIRGPGRKGRKESLSLCFSHREGSSG